MNKQTDLSDVPAHERPTEPPEDERASTVDHECETLPPFDRDRPTVIIEDPNLCSLTDACRVIVTSANVLSRSEAFDSRTKIRCRLIGSDVRKILESPSAKTLSDLKREANSVVSEHLAKIERAMRRYGKAISSEEKTAYVQFRRACTRIE